MTRRQEDRDRIIARLAVEVDVMAAPRPRTAVSRPYAASAPNSPDRGVQRPQGAAGAVLRRVLRYAADWKQRARHRAEFKRS
ncbi:hypothetical protein [Streptomyces mirabilis]|uniref:hypothetical protein n=1 Tax=Streptomyces mirabilis TaxID=68239 RepID=UPI00332CF589